MCDFPKQKFSDLRQPFNVLVLNIDHMLSLVLNIYSIARRQSVNFPLRTRLFVVVD